MTKKGGSDSAFMQRVIEGAAAAVPEAIAGAKAPRAGMVMTHPPTGPNKTLDELLEGEQSVPAVPHTTLSGRTLIFIRVALIDPNPQAPRWLYTPAMIKARADDLRAQGQHDPIHVIPHPTEPGRYMIADGWTRVQACRDHKVLDELWAEVHYDLSLGEAAWFGYQQNEGRQNHCALDRAMFYAMKIADGESAAEIARRTGVSEGLISHYKAFSKLPPEILDIVKEHPDRFGVAAGHQIYQLYDAKGLRKAINQAEEFAANDHSVLWLKKQVQAAIRPEERGPVVPFKRQVFSNGHYKQCNNEFEVVISVIDPDKRAAFATALETLLSTVALQKPEGSPES